MPVAYERYTDDDADIIQVEDHERSGGSDEESEPEEHEHRLHRAHVLLANRWPKHNGLLQIATGCILTFLGLVEVIVIPVAMDRTGGTLAQMIALDRSNLYGLGIWTGVLLTITGSLALRTNLFRSLCTVYTFFSAILLDVVVFTGAVLFLLIGYSKHWTTRGALNNGALYGVHIGIAVCVGVGLILILHAFTQYYEDVFCGELQLARRCVHCCCPCWCPPAVNQHELQNPHSSARPPSLPV